MSHAHAVRRQEDIFNFGALLKRAEGMLRHMINSLSEDKKPINPTGGSLPVFRESQSEREAFIALLKSRLAVQCGQCGINESDVTKATDDLAQLSTRSDELIAAINRIVPLVTSGLAPCAAR